MLRYGCHIQTIKKGEEIEWNIRYSLSYNIIQNLQRNTMFCLVAGKSAAYLNEWICGRVNWPFDSYQKIKYKKKMSLCRAFYDTKS